MMITDQEIENINKAFAQLTVKEKTEAHKIGVLCGLFVVKKTSHVDEYGQRYVSKSFVANPSVETELWYRTFVTILVDILIKRYLKGKAVDGPDNFGRNDDGQGR